MAGRRPSRKVVPLGPVQAAEYIRMSTEHQQYSVENQRDALQRFAAERSITIVRSFVDYGKSGVSIHGRDALQELLRTVESGQANFSTILVYDVSRWGRFQEPDEGAFYEFRCLLANITVQYSAEQFPTGNTPMLAVLKSVRRASAGEFSRDLSTKVFAGQCRLVTLGFHQGGTPGYGLRRLLLDQGGRPKVTLARGERKSLQMERVILTPGPEEEVATVRRVYQLFTSSGQTQAQIAAALNSEGVATETGRPWTPSTIRELLTNEKYIGNNLYNRTSAKLQRPRIRNRPEDWVRCNGAFTPIVDADVFAAAQRIIHERERRYTDDELLQLLRELLKERGALSGILIDEAEGMPSASSYRHRFQSLHRAYQLIGYSPRRDLLYLAINRVLRALYQEHLGAIKTELTNAGATVVQNPVTDILTINAELTAALIVARCREIREGEYRWLLRFDTSLDPDITVAARMAPGNNSILDYYLFPAIDVLTDQCRLAPENGFVLDVYRFADLAPLINVARTTVVPEAA